MSAWWRQLIGSAIMAAFAFWAYRRPEVVRLPLPLRVTRQIYGFLFVVVVVVGILGAIWNW